MFLAFHIQKVKGNLKNTFWPCFNAPTQEQEGRLNVPSTTYFHIWISGKCCLVYSWQVIGFAVHRQKPYMLGLHVLALCPLTSHNPPN